MRFKCIEQYSFCLRAIVLVLVTAYGCMRAPGDNYESSGRAALIEPDYSGITIPPNMAPMNFIIRERGYAYQVIFRSGEENFTVYSRDGIVRIPNRKWKKLLSGNRGNELSVEIIARDDEGKWLRFTALSNHIAKEDIDPYIYYRLLYPGYESWSELSINRRSLESFRTGAFIENDVADENCINCHSFNNGHSGEFMFHMRGSKGGTYILSEGRFGKFNLRTAEMKNGAVYPRWHPSGSYIAFSSNKIIQRFHASDNKKVEVSDLESSLVLYDVKLNRIMDIPLAGTSTSMDTYPEWSPDGRYLYFCRAPQVSGDYDYRQIRYDLWRVPFNPENMSFGTEEIVFSASGTGRSAAFPRISPDGRFLAVTLADYGCFPIWHREADIVMLDLETMEQVPLEMNSDYSDSYHSWSSNGRWLIFSSKRMDGLTARPFIAYIENDGSAGKPFVLPQKDPSFYGRFLKSFNIPEFSETRVDIRPGAMRRLTSGKATDAEWKK